MNWSEWAAVAEMVGAVAVVATLLYLAKEIRQNSRAIQIAAQRDTTAQWNEWSAMLAGSTDLADIVAKGNKNYSALTEAEQLRYGSYVQCFIDNVEAYHILVIEHRVEKDIEVLAAIAGRRMAIPGFAAWLDENAADYDANFVAWLRSTVASHGR